MKEHVCEPAESICVCNVLADEPSERCTIHGGAPSSPRCKHCGKFMKRDKVEIEHIEPQRLPFPDFTYQEITTDSTSQECCDVEYDLSFKEKILFFFYRNTAFSYLFIFLVIVLSLMLIERFIRFI